MDSVIKYVAAIGGLIALYLIVSHGNESTMVIKALSSANTNGILALQGRPVNSF